MDTCSITVMVINIIAVLAGIFCTTVGSYQIYKKGERKQAFVVLFWGSAMCVAITWCLSSVWW